MGSSTQSRAASRARGRARMAPKMSFRDALEVVLIVLTGYAAFLYYNLVGHLASLRGVDLGSFFLTPLDRALPYVPELVWFYQLAYVVPLIALILIFRKTGGDVRVFRQLMLAFLSLLALHFALYLLLPTSAAAVRLPESSLGDGLLGTLVRTQYRLATPWNAWPSLHVSACWFFFRPFARHDPRLRWVYLFWFLGMLAGTAGIKIHYLLDGLTGLALGEAAYRLVLLRLERAGACAWRWRSDRLRIVVHLAILAALVAGIPVLMAVSGCQGPLDRFLPLG